MVKFVNLDDETREVTVGQLRESTFVYLDDRVCDIIYLVDATRQVIVGQRERANLYIYMIQSIRFHSQSL